MKDVLSYRRGKSTWDFSRFDSTSIIVGFFLEMILKSWLLIECGLEGTKEASSGILKILPEFR